MHYTLKVPGIKCMGCVETICKSVRSVTGIANVEINKDSKTVSFDAEDSEKVAAVKVAILKAGYQFSD